MSPTELLTKTVCLEVADSTTVLCARLSAGLGFVMYRNVARTYYFQDYFCRRAGLKITVPAAPYNFREKVSKSSVQKILTGMVGTHKKTQFFKDTQDTKKKRKFFG
jgi:hypothetical protein